MSAAGSRDSAAVRTSGLSKRYGTHDALRAVDLTVTRGSVYGLVGPNGAGKTTLLSILAGLRRQTAGTVDLGVDHDRVAVVPDTPNFERWLTGREVVDLARRMSAPDLPGAAVEDALERTGLREAADRRVGGYSRGMLQRLGLATGIVGEPALLILDEPSSALDPAGRREVLDFVAAARGGATVLFSSHILADVQEVCDTVGILRAGELLFQGSLPDLLVGRAAPGYVVRVRDGAEAVAAALRTHPWVGDVDLGVAGEVRVGVTSLDTAERNLAAALGSAGARVISVTPAHGTLEDVFLELTR